MEAEDSHGRLTISPLQIKPGSRSEVLSPKVVGVLCSFFESLANAPTDVMKASILPKKQCISTKATNTAVPQQEHTGLISCANSALLILCSKQCPSLTSSARHFPLWSEGMFTSLRHFTTQGGKALLCRCRMAGSGGFSMLILSLHQLVFSQFGGAAFVAPRVWHCLATKCNRSRFSYQSDCQKASFTKRTESLHLRGPMTIFGCFTACVACASPKWRAFPLSRTAAPVPSPRQPCLNDNRADPTRLGLCSIVAGEPLLASEEGAILAVVEY